MEPFIGQLMLVGFNFAPRGWARCDGQLLAISQNSALFSLLGTTYGGDGRSSFGLPDLRGRMPISVGQGPGLPSYSWGQRAGQYQKTLLITELPSHNHTLAVSSADATQTAATAGASIATPGMAQGRTFVPGNGFNTATPNTVLNNATVGNAGGNQSFSIQNPYIAMYWVIALQGIYPSRN